MGHRIGTFLVVIGIGILAWAATVYFWKDPFTTAYTAYEQRRLESKLNEQFEAYEPLRTPVVAHPGKPKPRSHDDVRREARRFRLASDEGDAIARLKIPRLGLSAVVVNGTGVGDLRRGPGRHLESYMPGERELVYIAGHRTTYGAPFGNRVTGHRIVDDNDVSVLKSPHHEELVLQACHPRFFASQRYLVYARPVSVEQRTGGA